MIRNFLLAELTRQVAHDGEGKIHFSRIFDSEVFQTRCHFVDYAVVPPGVSIGLHRHSDSEEIYIILAGTGTMVINDTQTKVCRGDIILNPLGGVHGFVNDAQEDVHIVVVEVGA
jgi:mannose-6-phosphate isomerase-like protein (cupin superfamily)